MPKLVTAALLAFLLPQAAQAGLVVQGDQASHVMAGGYCIEKPDSVRAEPGTAVGEVMKTNHGYHIILMGDHIPAETNLAAGVIFQMAEHRPGEKILMQITSLDQSSVPNTWMHVVGDDGKVWFSVRPHPGLALTPGRRRFSAFRGDQVLVIYDFTVVPAETNGDTAGPCAAAIS